MNFLWQCLIKMKDWSGLCQCGNFTHLTLSWNFSVASPSFDWLDNFLFSPRILLHCLKIQSKYSFVESKNKANKNPISSCQNHENSNKNILDPHQKIWRIFRYGPSQYSKNPIETNHGNVSASHMVAMLWLKNYY